MKNITVHGVYEPINEAVYDHIKNLERQKENLKRDVEEYKINNHDLRQRSEMRMRDHQVSPKEIKLGLTEIKSVIENLESNIKYCIENNFFKEKEDDGREKENIT